MGQQFQLRPDRQAAAPGPLCAPRFCLAAGQLAVVRAAAQGDDDHRSPRSDPPGGPDADEINPFLEEWYNQAGVEPATFVPYHHLLGPRRFTFPDLTSTRDLALDSVKPATITAIQGLLEDHLGRPLDEDERQPATSLDDLGLDSLERMDLALQIEDRFGFRSDRVAATVGELWALAEGRLGGSGEAAAPAPPAWSRPRRHRGPVALLAETVGEAFVRRALAQPGDVAVADRVSGVLTYRRLLVGASCSVSRSASCPVDAVGVMLPASVAADVVYFALLLAGKLPVMMNWTTGPANLAHAVQKMNIRHVVTAHRLIDRLGIKVEGAESGVYGRTAGPDRQVPGVRGRSWPPTSEDVVGCVSCRLPTPTTRPSCCSLQVRRAPPKRCRSAIAMCSTTCTPRSTCWR